MQIRLAKFDDVQALANLNDAVQIIHHEAWPKLFRWPTAKNEVEDALEEIISAKDNRFFIAEDSRGPKGYIFCEIVRKAEDAFHIPRELIYIHQIAVKAGSQRKGIGASLLNAVFGLAEAESIDLVMLDVWSFNLNAKEFFSKQGFTVYNERMMIDRSQNSEFGSSYR